MTWKAVCYKFVISQYLGVPSFHPLVGWVWCAEQDGDGGQPQQDAEGDDEQAVDEWDRGWGCGEDQLGHKIVVNTEGSKNEWLLWLTPRWGRIGTHLSNWTAISAQFDQGLSINNQPQTPFFRETTFQTFLSKVFCCNCWFVSVLYICSANCVWRSLSSGLESSHFRMAFGHLPMSLKALTFRR